MALTPPRGCVLMHMDKMALPPLVIILARFAPPSWKLSK